MENTNDILLNVSNLQTYFYTDEGVVKALDGVNFTIPKVATGSTLGVVGESRSVIDRAADEVVRVGRVGLVMGELAGHRVEQIQPPHRGQPQPARAGAGNAPDIVVGQRVGNIPVVIIAPALALRPVKAIQPFDGHPLAGPIRADLGITDFQFSLVHGLGFVIFYSVLGIPIARLADARNRRNIRKAMALFEEAGFTVENGVMTKPDGTPRKVLDVSKLNDNQLSWIRASRIGFVFQSYHLLPEMDVLENVSLPAMAAGGAATSAS